MTFLLSTESTDRLARGSWYALSPFRAVHVAPDRVSCPCAGGCRGAADRRTEVEFRCLSSAVGVIAFPVHAGFPGFRVRDSTVRAAWRGIPAKRCRGIVPMTWQCRTADLGGHPTL